MSGLCAFVLVFFVMLLASPVLPVAAVLPAAVTIGLVASVGWYLHVQHRERLVLRRLAEEAIREAAVGQVQSTNYTIKDAVAVEEREDEGLSYFLLLDDGRTLFLSGQYLYEPADRGFPWVSFEIVQAPLKGDVLRVVQRGPAMTPSRKRGPFSDEECDSGAVPDDSTIEIRDFNALKTEGRLTGRLSGPA